MDAEGMSANFMDPRLRPEPPYVGPVRLPAEDMQQVVELIQLCRGGHIYDVEQWIRAGRPLYAKNYRTSRSHFLDSPLAAAINRNQYDLAFLLLCNGYPPDDDGSLLEQALTDRAFQYVELMLEWGADPKRVSAETVLETYDTKVIDRFVALGVDVCHRHVLAEMLARHSTNRAAFGWAKRHHDDPRVQQELDLAVGEAVMEGRERVMHMLLWAGADPRARVPILQYWEQFDEVDDDDPGEWDNAIERAATYCGKFLPALKPKADRDDFDRLWARVADEEGIAYLTSIQPPTDWSSFLMHNLQRAAEGYGEWWKAKSCIEQVSTKNGARLTNVEGCAIDRLRRDILKSGGGDIRWVLTWLSSIEHCEPEIFRDLTCTRAMQLVLVHHSIPGKRTVRTDGTPAKRQRRR